MSAQRLALSNFLRNGPRLALLPHNPIQSQNDPRADEEDKKGKGLLVESVAPYLHLLGTPCAVPQFQASLSPHIYSHLFDSVGASHLKYQQSDSSPPAVLHFVKEKTRTTDVSVQTSATGDCVCSAPVERVDRLKWDLENKIGEDLMEEGLFEQALYRFRGAAFNGNKEALYNLAECLFNGLGAKENKKEAFLLWRKAAGMGHSSSMYSLAVCLLRGEGTSQNSIEAHSWMEKASKLGNADAAFYLTVRKARLGVKEGLHSLVRTASSSYTYRTELQSWLRDNCVSKDCQQILRIELSKTAP